MESHHSFIVSLNHSMYAPELLAAGWLHDTLEDTSLSLEGLGAVVGEPVSVLVDACTDGEGANRKARKERPYMLIPKTPDTIVIKLADRIANVEAAIEEGKPDLLGMYRKEHPEFRKRLYGSPASFDVEPMWKRLARVLPES